MKLGIIGLRSSGKTTLFNAVTAAGVPTGVYVPPTEPPHVHQVKVPDGRLDFLFEKLEVKKKVNAAIDFVDVPGISTGSDAHREDNAVILAHIREMDAVIVCLCNFDDPAHPHPLARINPAADYSEVNFELTFADTAILEKRMEKIKKNIARNAPSAAQDKIEMHLLEKCQKTLSENKPLSDLALTEEDWKHLASFAFLTLKKQIPIVNCEEGKPFDASAISENALSVFAKLEEEIEELPEDERATFFEEMGVGESAISRVIKASYDVLGAITFFTHNEEEVRAWTVQSGSNAVTAAGKVHTDMAKGFIKAEVVHFDDFKEHGSVKELRGAGKYRLEGRDYTVQDGDIIQFKFNV
jgi:GTP-binding protein YchF